MSAWFLILVGCGSTSTSPPVSPEPAPEVKLEDYMATCMGSGDCVAVATQCCGAGPVAVNKANQDHVKKQAASCAAVKCEETRALPAVECKNATCVLSP